MNTRKNVGHGRGEAAFWGNKFLPQAPAAETEMLVNPASLIDGEVKTTPVQIFQAIFLQVLDMKDQEEQQGIPWKNPPANTMASRLRDFTRMNPPVYVRSKIAENLKEECMVAIMNDRMGISRLKVHVQQVEEARRGSILGQGIGQGKRRKFSRMVQMKRLQRGNDSSHLRQGM